MSRLVGHQKSGSKNNKDKNKTATCDINCPIENADLLSSSDKIQEIDNAHGNGSNSGTTSFCCHSAKTVTV